MMGKMGKMGCLVKEGKEAKMLEKVWIMGMQIKMDKKQKKCGEENLDTKGLQKPIVWDLDPMKK